MTVGLSLVLVVLAFMQRPGKLTFDTKLDLTEDPLGFLSRALHLWNPQNASGELQNQAYGYFFPVGPFFAGGDLLGLPGWVTQRLWCALLLVVAFYGALRLARALRVGSEPARYVAALGYALAPRMLTEIGPVSAEMLPVVLLPWVMLPLVNAHRHSPRRAAGLSALGVLLMGGINATVILAALVLPGLWLITREWTREHRRLVLWWVAFVVLACLWWLIPLLLLGRYSLPFLDYIESAANTTGPLSLTQVLRGTDHWVGYLAVDGPWWPSGFALVHQPALIVVTVLIAVIGLAGLLRRELPHRRFLVLAVVVGTTLLAIGYVGTLDSPVAETVRSLLDGPLAPLRNVHKFEPVLRLPLMLAVAHAVSRLWLPARGRSQRWLHGGQVAVASGLIVVLAAPAWQGTLRPGPGWDRIPPYWEQALDWVGEQDRTGRTLLLPATGFGLYTWGDTIDEPAQTIASAPWSVRNQVPLGSEGNTRLMDAIQDAVDTGLGSRALADLLARSGYQFLVLRNDVDAPSTKAPPRTVLRQALVRSPGITRVATFGPKVKLPDLAVAGAADQDAPAVPRLEVYRVQRPVPLAQTTQISGIPVVSGGPESLLQLLEQGVLRPGQPTLFAEDRVASPQAWLVADGLRKRERNVGIVRRNTGQTMTAAEQPRMTRPARDIVPFSGDKHTTTAEYRGGLASVTASSSRGYADAIGSPDRGHQPFAAFDGDPNTSWRSSAFSGAVGQWIEAGFDRPRFVGEVTVQFVKNLHVGQPVRRIRIDTDLGAVEADARDEFGPQRLAVPPGLTSRLRITVVGVEGDSGGDAAISEIAIPEVKPVRALRVPLDVVPPAGIAPTFSFSRGSDTVPACFTLDDGSLRCDEELATAGEEPLGPRRVFRTGEAARYRATVSVLPSYGGPLPVVGEGVHPSSTSQMAGDPTASAYSAVDGDPETSWIADGDTVRPVLRLNWAKPRRISSLRLEHSRHPVSSQPKLVRVVTAEGSQQSKVASDGTVDIDPVTTNQLEIVVVDIDDRPADVRFPKAPAPAGIAEIEINGEQVVRKIDKDDPFTVPCGFGPEVRIDGKKFTTTITGTVGQYHRSEPMTARLCDKNVRRVSSFELLPGVHQLTSFPTGQFVVRDIALVPAEAPPTKVQHRETTVLHWGTADRSVRVGPGGSAVLALAENANAGWQATLGGRTLRPTRVDGWRQAWVVPPGSGGTVQLEFTPDDTYRVGLLAGAGTVVVFLVLLLLPGRLLGGPAAAGRGTRRQWPAWLAAAALLLLGGWAAAVALVLAVGVGLWWRRAPVAVAATGLTAAAGLAVWSAIAGGQEFAYAWYPQAAWLAALSGILAVELAPALRRIIQR